MGLTHAEIGLLIGKTKYSVAASAKQMLKLGFFPSKSRRQTTAQLPLFG